MYPDSEKYFHKKRVTYKYTSNDINKSKANKEYVRSQVYDVINKSINLNQNSQNQKAKTSLNDMKNWLVENKQIYQGSNSDILFLNDISLALMHCDNIQASNNIESKITCKVMSSLKKSTNDSVTSYITKSQKHFSNSSRRLLKDTENEERF